MSHSKITKAFHLLKCISRCLCLKTEKKNVPTFSFSSGPDPVTSLCRSTQSEKPFWGSLLISRFWFGSVCSIQKHHPSPHKTQPKLLIVTHPHTFIKLMLVEYTLICTVGRLKQSMKNILF